MKSDRIFNVSDSLVRVIGLFFITAIIARNFSIEEFGEYSITVTIKNILLVAVSFGSDGLLLRRFSKSKEETCNALIKKIINFKYLWASLLALLISLILEIHIAYVLILLISLTFFPLLTLENYFKAKSQTKHVFLCSSITYFLVTLGALYFHITGAPAYWFLFLMVIDPVVLALTLMTLYLVRQNKVLQTHNSILLKKINEEFSARTLTALTLSALATVILGRSDVLIVGYFEGNIEAAKISAISRLNALSFFPILAVQQILLSLKEKDSDKLVSRFSWIIFFYCTLVSLFYLFFGDFILSIVYGEKYSSLNKYLFYYSLSNFFFMMPVVMAFWYYDKYLQNFVAMKNIFVVFMYIILASIAVVYSGLEGVITVYIFAGFFLFIIGDFFHPEARKLKHLFFKLRN